MFYYENPSFYLGTISWRCPERTCFYGNKQTLYLTPQITLSYGDETLSVSLAVGQLVLAAITTGMRLTQLKGLLDCIGMGCHLDVIQKTSSFLVPMIVDDVRQMMSDFRKSLEYERVQLLTDGRYIFEN